jgi:hypothetical protein
MNVNENLNCGNDHPVMMEGERVLEVLEVVEVLEG